MSRGAELLRGSTSCVWNDRRMPSSCLAKCRASSWIQFLRVGRSWGCRECENYRSKTSVQHSPRRRHMRAWQVWLRSSPRFSRACEESSRRHGCSTPQGEGKGVLGNFGCEVRFDALELVRNRSTTWLQHSPRIRQTRARQVWP